MKLKKRYLVAVILAILIVVLGTYLLFFYAQKCGDEACFNSGLEKCRRVRYTEETPDAVWKYQIQGGRGNNCRVYAELVRLKKGKLNIENIEGKSMICELPYSLVAKPQENLARCHGLLKEEMQTLIINKLHNYILDNLGKIGGELEKAL